MKKATVAHFSLMQSGNCPLWLIVLANLFSMAREFRRQPAIWTDPPGASSTKKASWKSVSQLNIICRHHSTERSYLAGVFGRDCGRKPTKTKVEKLSPRRRSRLALSPRGFLFSGGSEVTGNSNGGTAVETVFRRSGQLWLSSSGAILWSGRKYKRKFGRH
jgi:hypothetical protein